MNWSIYVPTLMVIGWGRSQGRKLPAPLASHQPHVQAEQTRGLWTAVHQGDVVPGAGRG